MTLRSWKTGFTTSTGFGLDVFSQDELDMLHYATLELLWETGIKVETKEAFDLFQNAGATGEWFQDYGIIKIPSYITEDCIRSAPRTVVFYGREAKNDYVAEPKRVGFSTFGECIQIIDPDTRKVRKSVKSDLAGATLMCDYLDEIAVVERAMCSSDQYPHTQPLHNYEAMVTNTSKHCFLGFGSGENAKKILEMAAACVGGKENLQKRPIVTAFVCPTSPLTLVKSCCDVIMECAKAGMGIAIIPMALCGATSTATLAGTLVQHNAEVLSALILAQLTRKGTPCTYSSCSTIMDLRFTATAVGAPEYGIISAGLTKLAQYYQLPCWVGGGHSDSKIPDAQAAYEFSLTATVSALAGANIVYGAGCLESGLTFDYAKMMMDAEQIRRIFHVIRGIEVNDKTIALDVIHEVGPGGEFMTHQHTFENMRSMSQCKLFDRRNRDGWMERGGKDLTERAYEEAKHVLETHKPAPLTDGAAETMKSIIEDYETELKAEKQKEKRSTSYD
ncbi:MAG: trimethylamine methyltransferase family protein [Bacillota bacterium]|nr:trimethylamine methyltransferase family protein [Bacillota bacterium]